MEQINVYFDEENNVNLSTLNMLNNPAIEPRIT